MTEPDAAPSAPQPADTLAPVTCPQCQARVPAADGGHCPQCGARFDRAERIVDEHGPEAFVPGALPWRNDLSGPALIIEGGIVVALGLLLLIIVYRFFGYWSPAAAAFAVVYWGCYGLVRRRTARRTLRTLIAALQFNRGGDDPSAPGLY